MRKKLFTLAFVLLALSLPGFAQLSTGPITSSASTCPTSNNSSCVVLQLSPQIGQVAITVNGTFTAALQFEWSADGGSSWVSLNATPNGGGSPVASTTNGAGTTAVWVANVGGGSFARVRGSSYTSGVATVAINPNSATTLGGVGGTIPILNSNGVTPASFANECASVTVDTSGNALTAIAFLRTMGNAGVVHDVMCMVTADAVFPSTIGAIVFPFGATISPGAARATAPKNVLSIANTAGAAVLELSNLTGTNRQNSINFRTCAGPGGTNCGTDLVILEDPTSTFKEEFLFQLLGGNYPLYMGNVLNSAHGGIMLGGADASCLLNVTTCASFGLLRPPAGSTNSDHLVRLSTHADMWNTATMAAGTVTVTFQSAFTSAPICIATWQGGGVLTGIVKCVTSTTTAVLTSSVNTDTAVMGYLILGNNN